MIAQFTGCSHLSHYGAATIGDIISRTKELGFKFVTLAEHGNASSAIEFYSGTKKAGLQPILGVQVYVRDKWSRPIYAKKGNKKIPELVEQFGLVTIHFLTEKSYLQFCQLTPKFKDKSVKDELGERAILNLEDLKQLNPSEITVGTSLLEGLIGKVFDCGNLDIATQIYSELKQTFGTLYVEVSPLPKTSTWFKPMFDRSGGLIREGAFVEDYVEEHTPSGDTQKDFNNFMINLAKQHGDIIVPSLDFHFAKPSQKLVQDAKLSKDGKSLVKFYHSNHIRSSSEIEQLFTEMGYDKNDIAEWFANINNWAERFTNFRLTTYEDRWVLKKYDGDLIAELKKRIDRHGRMDWSNSAMIDRLKMEVRVLADNGQINLLHYIFTVEDAANWCKEKGLLMNVRGSAGGSLLMYLLGVSAFNPLKHDLQFERFLTEGRIKSGTLPDVDIDLSDQTRFIEEYLYLHYGDAACRISTDMVLKLKSSIKDTERAFFTSVRPETEKLTKSFPPIPQGMDEHEFVFGKEEADGSHTPGLIDTNPDLQKYANENPEVWQTVSEMLGVMRNKSTHACGFLIADKPVQEYIPVTYINGTRVSAFSPKQVELAGLIKFDFLGLNTLKDVEECLRSIKERTGIDVDPFNLPEDPKCYEAFAKGETETVFQFNTPTVIPYLKAIQPKSIDDLAAITALCRPGTLDAPAGDGRTLAKLFIDRSQGEPIKYIHDDLEPILAETKGIQLYQEQTLRIFRDIAGYSYEQAEVVRRGIGKKIESVLESCMGDLRTACLNRGWNDQQINLLIDQIMASSRYSFNKAHAISYAYNAYACMWLKTNYPLDWWKATLSNAHKDETATVFWSHVKDFTDLPMLNLSTQKYEIHGDRLVSPLSIITGLGPKTFKSLIDHSPYRNLEHFISIHFNKREKGLKSPVTKSSVFKLIAAGVLDSLLPDPKAPVDQKIYAFLQAKAEFNKEKSIEAVPEEYFNMTTFSRYMLKKSLVKMYSEDLRPMILPSVGGFISAGQWKLKSHTMKYKNEINYLNGRDFSVFKDNVENKENFLLPYDVYFGLVAYILDEKTFTYQGKSKQATKVWIDVNGYVSEEVIWPDYGTNMAKYGYKNNICLIIMRANEGRDGKNRLGIYDIRPILTKK